MRRRRDHGYQTTIETTGDNCNTTSPSSIRQMLSPVVSVVVKNNIRDANVAIRGADGQKTRHCKAFLSIILLIASL